MYAEDIGISRKTLEGYRKVARAYPILDVRTASNLPWSVFNVFCSQPDREGLVADSSWTVATARAEVASRSQVEVDRRARIEAWSRSQSRRNPDPAAEARSSVPVAEATDLGRPRVQSGDEVDLTDLMGPPINDDVVVEYLNGKSHEDLVAILRRVRLFMEFNPTDGG